MTAGAISGAQSPQQAKLKTVRVTGSAKIAEAYIVDACGLKPGEPVTKEDIQAAADRLAQMGPFQNVRYKFQSKGEDLEIEFQVEDAPSVRVSFDNFATFSDEELNAALKAAVPFYDGTAPEQGTVLDVMSDALQKLLDSRGIKATIERTLLAGAGDEGNIQQFKINAPAMKVKAVAYGDELISSTTKLSEPVRALLGKPFSRFSTSVFVVEHVRPFYAQRGFLKARFGEPQVRFEGNPNRALPDEVTVLIPIERGPVYKLGGVTWSGNRFFDVSTLGGFFGLLPGDVADGMKTMAGWENVKKEYGRRGYIEADVTADSAYDDAKATVSFAATVKEGAQYRMGQLIITGLSLTAERKLIAAWRLAMGEIFDQVYFEEFVDKQAEKKGAFGDYVVTYTKVGYLLRPNEQTKTVDVLFDFK
jgi:outer membrane protein insertion porin family